MGDSSRGGRGGGLDVLRDLAECWLPFPASQQQEQHDPYDPWSDLARRARMAGEYK